MSPVFSIITPCFNSSATLLSTYESLLRQACADFDWILVDDASTDNGQTKTLINKLQRESPFNVKTIFLENNYFGSRSVFAGCGIAEGKYIAILDHDDQLTPDALQYVNNHLDKYGNVKEIAGVCGRCVDESGQLIGEKFHSDCFLANEAEVRFEMGITSELFQFTRVEVAMPFFALMEPGYTNGFVWAKIAQKHNYIYVNDVLRIYDTVLPTSYSNTKSMTIRYPDNKAKALKETLICYRPHLRRNILYSLQLIGSYVRHTINAKQKYISIFKGFDIKIKFLVFLLYPISYAKAKGFF
ncbi:MAG: glycosyltransferase family 2 protein [Methylococcales bacterium]